MTIYDHANDYFALQALIEEAMTDSEGNPIELEAEAKDKLYALANEWKEDFAAKAERICKYRLELVTHAEACAEESKRIALKGKRALDKANALTYVMHRAMEMINVEKFAAGTFDLRIQKNPPKLVVDDESRVPSDFFEEVPATLKLVNAKLKQAIIDGTEVPGARVVQDRSLRIK